MVREASFGEQPCSRWSIEVSIEEEFEAALYFGGAAMEKRSPSKTWI
jgi:hypothetical protein